MQNFGENGVFEGIFPLFRNRKCTLKTGKNAPHSTIYTKKAKKLDF
jgi:hypothetical protein